MEIKTPEILKYQSKVAFDNFCDYYNVSQQFNRNKLKSTHIQLYRFLIDKAASRLRAQLIITENKENFTAPENYEIYIMPSYIKASLKCSKNTAKARLRRLQQAEAINLIYDQTTQEYKVIFNPSLLFIKGENNPNPEEKSIFSKKLKYSPLNIAGGQNLTPSISIKSIKLINKSIIVSGVYNSQKRIINELENIKTKKHKKQDKEFIEQNKKTKLKKTPEKFSKQNEKKTPENFTNRLEEYRYNAVLRLLNFAIQLLYQGRIIFDDEYKLAFDYIVKNYFNHNNIRDLYKFEIKAIKRIELAANYCKKNNYEIAAFPSKYFDKNFKYGFNNTSQWLINQEKNKIKRQTYNQEKTDRQTVIRLYYKFKQNTGIENFTQTSNYIKTLIPDQLDNFMILTQQDPDKKTINKFLETGKINY